MKKLVTIFEDAVFKPQDSQVARFNAAVASIDSAFARGELPELALLTKVLSSRSTLGSEKHTQVLQMLDNALRKGVALPFSDLFDYLHLLLRFQRSVADGLSDAIHILVVFQRDTRRRVNFTPEVIKQLKDYQNSFIPAIVNTLTALFTPNYNGRFVSQADALRIVGWINTLSSIWPGFKGQASAAVMASLRAHPTVVLRQSWQPVLRKLVGKENYQELSTLRTAQQGAQTPVARSFSPFPLYVIRTIDGTQMLCNVRGSYGLTRRLVPVDVIYKGYGCEITSFASKEQAIRSLRGIASNAEARLCVVRMNCETIDITPYDK